MTDRELTAFYNLLHKLAQFIRNRGSLSERQQLCQAVKHMIYDLEK